MGLAALLPMKEHSERIHNKNMCSFAEKPLYHHIAGVLESSRFINIILINTDSKQISEDAKKNFSKVKIIKRPLNLRGDTVPMNNIIAYDINLCENEHFLQTHSTNPLLKKETIEQAIQEYFNSLKEYDSLFSVTKVQSRLYWTSGQPVNHNPKELLRTQDLKPIFEENSNMYIFSKTSFASAKNNRIGLRPKMFIMDKLEAIDIDEEDDFRLAETLFQMRREDR